MSIDISTISAVSRPFSTSVSMPMVGSLQKNESFSSLLESELVATNMNIAQAENIVSKAVAGEAVNLHDVAGAIDKARLSLEFVVQVRNKILESYQEVVKMSV